MNLIPPLPKTISLGRRLKQPERLVACLPHLNWQSLRGVKVPIVPMDPSSIWWVAESESPLIMNMFTRMFTYVHTVCRKSMWMQQRESRYRPRNLTVTQHLPLNRNPPLPAAECPFRSHKVKVSFSVMICNKVLQLIVQVNPLPAEARSTCPVMGTRWEGQARHSR